MSSAGKTRCLDAFIIALSQASERDEKLWYASTLELQMVSLGFCTACQSTPTLHVNVDYRTPHFLWPPIHSKARTPPSCSKVRISNRVPVVRALHLTWALPLEMLLQLAASELWAWSEVLHLREHTCLQHAWNWQCGLESSSAWNGTPFWTDLRWKRGCGRYPCKLWLLAIGLTKPLLGGGGLPPCKS